MLFSRTIILRLIGSVETIWIPLGVQLFRQHLIIYRNTRDSISRDSPSALYNLHISPGVLINTTDAIQTRMHHPRHESNFESAMASTSNVGSFAPLSMLVLLSTSLGLSFPSHNSVWHVLTTWQGSRFTCTSFWGSVLTLQANLLTVLLTWKTPEHLAHLLPMILPIPSPCHPLPWQREG